MALNAKPSTRPLWATTPGTDTNGNSLLVAPSAGKQAAGWILEKPAVQYWNWWWNLVYQWISYFESATDARSQEWNCIVTSGTSAAGNPLGTHAGTTAGLTQAIADCPAGGKILVLDSIVLSGTVTVNKLLEIYMKPGVALSGSSITGLSCTVNGIRIRGGQMTGFSNAISINTGVSRVKVGDVDFSSNGTDVADPDGNSVVHGCSPS